MNFPDYYIQSNQTLKDKNFYLLQINPIQTVNIDLKSSEFAFVLDENKSKLYKLNDDELEILFEQISQNLVLDLQKKEKTLSQNRNKP